jgi:hypothetical protein
MRKSEIEMYLILGHVGTRRIIIQIESQIEIYPMLGHMLEQGSHY